jgi:LytR cell envelope-related transcriptional attenuator
MADTRSYRAILEQPGRRWIWLALIAAFVLLAGLSGFLFRPRRAPAADQAYAIPAVKGRLMVEVLNGTRRQGVARTATRMLRSHGVDVVFLGNADSTERLTRVIVRRGDPTRARTVSAVLGTGTIVVEADTFRRVDVSVILGEDFRPILDIHP